MLRVTTKYYALIWLLLSLLNCTCGGAQEQRGDLIRSRSVAQSDSSITGVYRIDIAESDKLYSVVSGASSNLPFAEQQRFFIDLAVRLTPPDLLAIEQRGKTISIASSRAPRISFEADGVQQKERTTGGRFVSTRAVLSGDGLTVSADGSDVDDSFSVTFEPIDDGRRLRVTRRLYAAQLNEPVVVRSVYDKISQVAEWSIYGEPKAAPTNQTASASPASESIADEGTSASADQLRAELGDWVSATNARNVRRLITFYSSEIKAFYLKRNVTPSFVREERTRAFRQSGDIEVHAANPEIIFSDEGNIAIMRFHKQYSTEVNGLRHSGEVIQELRWRKTELGWKIFSERDVKVLR